MRMHCIAMFLLAFVSFAGCKSSGGAGVKSRSFDSVEYPGDEAVAAQSKSSFLPCSMELAVICPAGQVDACFRDPDYKDGHVCVSDDFNRNKVSASCSREIAVLCPEGQIDQCMINPSGSHVCVTNTRRQPESAVVSSSPCSMEFALICPQGQIDRCVLSQEINDSHECIPRPKTKQNSDACAQEIAALCDEYKIDACVVNPSDPRGHVCVTQPKYNGIRCRDDNDNGRMLQVGDSAVSRDCNSCFCAPTGDIKCSELGCVGQ